METMSMMSSVLSMPTTTTSIMSSSISTASFPTSSMAAGAMGMGSAGMGSVTGGYPYVPLWPYNGTVSTGGDSELVNLNLYYQGGDIAWALMATVLVVLQIPGAGFFYAGLTRRKSALTLLWLSLMALAVTSFQWFFWGYSLTFSHKAGKYIGALDNFGFRNVLAQPSTMNPRISDLLNGIFMGMMNAFTVAILVGAVAERGRMLPCAVFVFIWSTIIWDPIACWTWNMAGWAARLGALDFAGGTPVHIAAGASALAYSYVLGKRRGYGTSEVSYRPHNVTLIVLGTVFMWIGWFGFNAGSANTATLRAVMAAVVTNLSAACGAITWCLLDYRLERKFSVVGFCSGAVAGLVCITPASGFVPPWAALVIGVAGATASNFATKLKYLIHCDDALDIFAVHAVAGFVGNLLTGLFAADYIAALDGNTVIAGGWINHHYIQLAYQLALSIAGLVYAFGGTCIILLIMNQIPGLHLKATEEAEILGLDDAELGEFAYDYVELMRDVVSGPVAGDADNRHSVSRANAAGNSYSKNEAVNSDEHEKYSG